jgi:HEAT repeats
VLDASLRPLENRGMETSSDVPEAEAYIPRAPGPDVERSWLPSTRAFAIEWARQARLVGDYGLAVDDATLERVADAIMDPANPPPWEPYTAEERKDRLPRYLWDAVHGYLNEHDLFGYVDIRWRDGRRTFVVGVVGDPEPHRAPLARIGGSRVVVERRPAVRPRTEAELRAIADRIQADAPELTTAGLSAALMDSLPELGVVEVHVVGGPNARGAAAFFAERYGEAVSVVWLGPRRLLEFLRPFGSWTSGGRWIRVFYALDPNGEQPGEARVAEENDERIVIALSSFEPARIVKTLMGGFHPRHADVELREPVGGRAVIDASAGVARPSLAQLGLPAKPPPLLRVVPTRAAAAPSRRRRAQVWFSATDDDAVYEAMLPAGDPPLDEDGDPVVMPAVRRDVLDAVRRDIAKTVHASAAGLSLSWVDSALVAERDDGEVQAFMPGPDGLYEVGRLAAIAGSRWVEVDPPLPGGLIDADVAVDLLSRVKQRDPTQGLILGRLDIDVLRAARPRVTDQAIRDAIDDEIAKRTHGLAAMLFGHLLRKLERNTSDLRGHDAYYLDGLVAHNGREEILGLAPDAGERVLALARTERDPDAKGSLMSALGRLGHRPAIPDLLGLLDDPYRYVRVNAAWALGALRAGEAASALRQTFATERGRPEPPPPHEDMPTPTADQAEAELRAALLAVTEGRYDPAIPPAHPYPWAPDDR